VLGPVVENRTAIEPFTNIAESSFRHTHPAVGNCGAEFSGVNVSSDSWDDENGFPVPRRENWTDCSKPPPLYCRIWLRRLVPSLRSSQRVLPHQHGGFAPVGLLVITITFHTTERGPWERHVATSFFTGPLPRPPP
jgi:hypothetical protein